MKEYYTSRIKLTAYSLLVLISIALAILFSVFIVVDSIDEKENHEEEVILESEVVEEPEVIEESPQSPEPEIIVLPTTVIVESEVEEEVIEVVEESEPEIDTDELEMMALVIYQEAGSDSCCDETRIMVGNVVLNRVADDRFPNTIEEVLTQYRQYGMLWSTGLVWPVEASYESESHAVDRAYDCAERVLGGEKLLEDDVIWQAEFFQGTECVVYQDGTYFCR